MTVHCNISLASITNHSNLVSMLEPIFLANQEDEIEIKIDWLNTNSIKPDYLLLIVTAVNFVKENEMSWKGTFVNMDPNSDCVKYSSRMDFFENLGFDYDESFNRISSEGRFTEISSFSDDNALDLHKAIMRVLINQNLNEEMLKVLEYCLWEVIDNTLNHSSDSFELGAGKCFICCQNFQYNNNLRIIIADHGKGIHKALTTHPKSNFKSLTESESVERSIERGVTNSTGMGFGLFSTAELIKHNKGFLIIHSGNHQLQLKEVQTMHETSFWQGTYTFLELNTNIPVDHKLIFGEDSKRDDDYNEFKEDLIGGENNLW
jgi:hypothetical protein